MVATALAKHGCNVPGKAGTFARLVVEKPFGHDLDSALALDETMHESFEEDQIYRIDHYMGKETVQNVLALRFANAIFEPVWNRRFVDHIQITVAKKLGVEHRGGFYEHAGALRDIVQNHVMQVLALTLMEPPVTIDAKGISDEKVKLLKAVEIPSDGDGGRDCCKGPVRGGRDRRREGPRLPRGRGRRPSQHDRDLRGDEALCRQLALGGSPRLRPHRKAARLAIRPRWHCNSTRCRTWRSATSLARDLRPGRGGAADPTRRGDHPRARRQGSGRGVQAAHGRDGLLLRDGIPGPEADGYERLLHDAMIGDPTLFIRTDEVEQAWRIVDPYLTAWAEGDAPLSFYPAGSWGPRESDRLLNRELRQWRNS